MSLALYLSRVRSSDLLGGPRQRIVTRLGLRHETDQQVLTDECQLLLRQRHIEQGLRVQIGVGVKVYVAPANSVEGRLQLNVIERQPYLPSWHSPE
jgi:hypothetical protein